MADPRHPGPSGALAGLRVVEIADDITGPYCAKLLVDLGADVTKIEPPSGDPLRRWGPFPGGVDDPNRSGMFEYLNAGKARGDTSTSRQTISAGRDLIGRAHVLVDGHAAGNLGRPTASMCTHWNRYGPDLSSFGSRTSASADRCVTASPRR